MKPILSRSLTLALLLAISGTALAADDAVVAQLNARLSALDNNPQLREQGAYERMQAMQAIARYDDSKRAERDSTLYVAQRRVEIAEIAAQTAVDNRQVGELDQTRNALLLEASRRETARVRQEAERLRVQQQIQAEEAERVRQQAEAEASAEAEQVMTNATDNQQAKLSAARQKDASLARQEAELVSGAKLPKSSFSADGAETFVLPASLFDAGKTSLSASGKSTVQALAAYMDATKGAKLRVDGYGDKQTPGARRSAVLRAALIAAGVPKARVSDGGAKGAGSNTQAARAVVTP
jgi:outer membrane protein OmpA-like peptidoglycan-associated protein